MPKGNITGINVTNGGTGYSANPTVAITDVYGTGTGATATATVVGGVITAISIDPGASGSGYTAPIITITDATGTGATAAAEIGGVPGTLTGGIRKFVDSLPGLGTANMNDMQQYIPVAIPDTTEYPPGGKGYTSAPAVNITDITGTGASATATVAGGTITTVTVNNGGSGYSPNPVITFIGGGAATHAIGKATVVGGVITEIRLLGCDYYEIELGEFSEHLHPDLPETRLRGYRQTNTADASVSQYHYMGPMIIAERDRPVRIKFTNSLPTGQGGDLFIPVDTTVMGSGSGPNMAMAVSADRVGGIGATVQVTTMAPHNLDAGYLVKLHGFTPDTYNGEFRVLPDGLTATSFRVMLKADPGGPATVTGHIMEMYAQNRATIHLHGGYVPWISDGTPHQGITPGGENTSYPEGVSVRNVTITPTASPGSMSMPERLPPTC